MLVGAQLQRPAEQQQQQKAHAVVPYLVPHLVLRRWIKRLLASYIGLRRRATYPRLRREPLLLVLLLALARPLLALHLTPLHIGLRNRTGGTPTVTYRCCLMLTVYSEL